MKALVPLVREDNLLDTETEPVAFLELCGFSLIERTLTGLRAAGITEVIIISAHSRATIESHFKKVRDLKLRIEYITVSSKNPTLIEAMLLAKDVVKDGFLLVPANRVFDRRIIEHLKAADGVTLCYDSSRHRKDTLVMVSTENGRIKSVFLNSPSGKEQEEAVDGEGVYTGLCKLLPEIFPELESFAERGASWAEALQQIVMKFDVRGLDIAEMPSYVPGMRRQVKPYWCEIKSPEDLKSCKRKLVQATQKGTLDFHAWYVNRHIENKILYYLSELNITPNQVTVLTNIVAYLATFFFVTGHLLAGSVLTYVVSVMDGVDGKLARIRGKLTKLGNIEHSFDFLFEQSWYVGLAWFLSSHPDRFAMASLGSKVPLEIALGIVLFNGFATHCYMQFKEVMGISLSDCAPFDRKFRRFDGRKNIYIYYILLGVIFEVPFYSLLAILAHAIVTAVVYALRACKHLEEADER